MRREKSRLGLALAAAPLAFACALNPVSRRPELVLVSEQEERAAGEEAAAQ